MEQGQERYRRFLAGDEDALGELVREYRDGLILYLHGIVGDLSLAEDLAEDTFARLGVKRPRDNRKASFKTWLYTIGRNIAIDHLRKQRKCKALSLEDYVDLSAKEDELERSYLQKERKILLHRTLASLRQEYAQILYLAYFEDFGNAEIAVILHKNKRQVENLLYNAKQSLKKALTKEGFVYEKL